MSTSSDNASIKDLVNPLMIIAKSVTGNNKSENNPFKEVKAVANYFFNGIKESIRNDEKLTNYRQFFSEINAIDKKLATMNSVSDSSKLDALVELEKTSTLISTGILKTTLDIKGLIGNFSFHLENYTLAKEFSFSKTALGSIGAASNAISVAELFKLGTNLKKIMGISAAVSYITDDISEYLRSNFDEGSWQHSLGGSLQDLADSMALAIIPHPAAWIAAGGLFVDKTLDRYAPPVVNTIWYETLHFLAPGGSRSVINTIKEPDERVVAGKVVLSTLADNVSGSLKDTFNSFENISRNLFLEYVLSNSLVLGMPVTQKNADFDSIDVITKREQHRNMELSGEKGFWDKTINDIRSIEVKDIGIWDAFSNLLDISPSVISDSNNVQTHYATNTFHNTFVLPQGTTLEQAKEVNSHLSQQREITQELNGGTS